MRTKKPAKVARKSASKRELLRAARAKRDALMARYVIVFDDGTTVSAADPDTVLHRPRRRRVT